MNKLLLHRICLYPKRFNMLGSSKCITNKVQDNSNHESINSSNIKNVTNRQIYHGHFSTRLKWLKRFSVTSSVFSMTIFPYLVHAHASAEIALAGKIAIVGTAILSSIGSTIMLKLITGPYVCAVYENEEENLKNDRELVVTQLNIFGQVEETKFRVSSVVKVTAAMHPFASFKVNEKYFYVGKDIKDEVLKKKLCY